jgi:hypothetical protein
MLNVQIAHSIISMITFLLAYGISVTIAGYFTAWMALKMGDETPAQEGFLSLNPLAHIDPLGTLFLMLYNFGWSKFIPINPFAIQGPLRSLKVVLVFAAKSIAHLGIGLFAMLALLALFGNDILHKHILDVPEYSSYLVAIGLILISMLVVNMVLAVITFFVDMCGLIVMLFVEKHPQYMLYTGLIMLIVPLALFYIFGQSLIMAIFIGIEKIGYFLAMALHLV